MMKGLYGKIRAKIFSPRLMVQKMRAARHFKKYADTGEDFVCSQTSDCLADRPGLITIGNHCEMSAFTVNRITHTHIWSMRTFF